jgi:PAS domain S-box-containing protein
MAMPLRVLLLEDRRADAELMLHELRRAGYTLDSQRVETRADFLAHLDPELDVILADFNLPQFDALRALHCLQERGLDVPFIIVTGSLNEEVAVECMKQGATDYLLKDRLARLGTAVAQAVQQKGLRQEKAQAEAALRESERRFRLLAENATDMISRTTPQGMYLYASPACRTLLGYAPEELVGRAALELVHPEDRAHAAGDPTNAELPDTYTITYRIRRNDGNYIWFETTQRKVRDDHTGAVAEIEAVSRDVSERKQAEERLKASLQEKEVLLREIHHRVKNNLQVIASLLKLQSGLITDRQACEAFLESRNRIRSMGLIHEQLYQSQDLGRIDFADYLNRLAAHMLRCGAAHSQDIALKVNVADVFLGIDTAIPCGLIINELVSNSLKHAFPAGKGGEIRIDFRSEAEQRFLLQVSDNGIGIADSQELPRPACLGLELVNALAKQLGATIERRNGVGTTFTFSFQELHYKQRG